MAYVIKSTCKKSAYDKINKTELRLTIKIWARKNKIEYKERLQFKANGQMISLKNIVCAGFV